MEIKNISVIGLGKLGCSMLACFAEKGFRVIGLDTDAKIVSKLSKHESPIYEPKVDKIIKKNAVRITATNDMNYAVQNSEVSFIIVPTPSLKDGSFNMDYIKSSVEEIASVLKTIEKYHLIVISSTVLPGDMEKIIRHLENLSGRSCGEDFGICYNPDFIALGNIVDDFLNPDMVLIGESDFKAGDLLQKVHEVTVENDPTYHRMSYHNAELAKIALNSFCTLKITFANVLAEICENMPNGDAFAVTNAIGDDVRVGNKYLRPGLGYGGPCFPRDNKAFDYSSGLFNVHNTFAELTHTINKYHSNVRLPLKIKKILDDLDINDISILGITYKDNTTLIEESSSLMIVKSLLKNKVKVKLYDPAGMPETKKTLSEFKNIQYCENMNEAILNSKVCFIGTHWKEFSSLNNNEVISSMVESPIIIDGCGVIKEGTLSSAKIIKIGVNK